MRKVGDETSSLTYVVMVEYCPLRSSIRYPGPQQVANPSMGCSRRRAFMFDLQDGWEVKTATAGLIRS